VVGGWAKAPPDFASGCAPTVRVDKGGKPWPPLPTLRPLDRWSLGASRPPPAVGRSAGLGGGISIGPASGGISCRIGSSSCRAAAARAAAGTVAHRPSVAARRPVGTAERHSRAIAQLVGAVDDNTVPGRQALLNCDPFAAGRAERHWFHCNGVCVDEIHERAGRTALDRARWHHSR